MMNYKKLVIAGLACVGMASVDTLAALSTDDYVEAAWMTTRFYGAQRSGEGPNWMSMGTNFTTSFTKDSYNGKDVSGGWFDCGDHVMFGQSQGYSSYILALAYAEFTEGFYDLYTGDYSDYKAADDFSRKSGKPNKVRDLLEELRYEADFWVKAAISSSAFVTVKGDGDMDHKNWVTPGKMSTMGTGEGGDPRPITGNANDSYTPGMAAAMLAVMARVDPDESNRTKYLAAAKTAFEYSKSHKGVTTSGNYYAESWWDGRWADGAFLAALELYRTTKDDSYKKEAESWWDKIEFLKGSYSRLNYANAVPLSVVMGQGLLDLQPGGQYRDMQLFLDNIYAGYDQNKDGIWMKETGGGGSFSVRTPSGGAFLYALYAKFSGDHDYDEAIEKNVAYLLGENSNKKSYVVGFDRNSAKAPTAPHHRGYYGNEDPGRTVEGMGSAPSKNKYFGAMIAGAFNDGNHSNSVSNWQVNEVCVDLNAPMVGALGYILSKKAPKTDKDLGIETPQDTSAADTSKNDSIPGAINPVVKLSDFTMSQSGMDISLTSVKGESFKVQVFDMQGNKIQEIFSIGGSVNFTLKAKGVLHMRVYSRSLRQIYTIKAI
ncbi:MAG: glycoside hydrolase family 9 protein [Fibrobacter sp.]|nr:glycoside hydrolase family 9 protein [Fibrobacter sp.]